MTCYGKLVIPPPKEEVHAEGSTDEEEGFGVGGRRRLLSVLWHTTAAATWQDKWCGITRSFFVSPQAESHLFRFRFLARYPFVLLTYKMCSSLSPFHPFRQGRATHAAKQKDQTALQKKWWALSDEKRLSCIIHSLFNEREGWMMILQLGTRGILRLLSPYRTPNPLPKSFSSWN